MLLLLLKQLWIICITFSGPFPPILRSSPLISLSEEPCHNQPTEEITLRRRPASKQETAIVRCFIKAWQLAQCVSKGRNLPSHMSTIIQPMVSASHCESHSTSPRTLLWRLYAWIHRAGAVAYSSKLQDHHGFKKTVNIAFRVLFEAEQNEQAQTVPYFWKINIISVQKVIWFNYKIRHCKAFNVIYDYSFNSVLTAKNLWQQLHLSIIRRLEEGDANSWSFITLNLSKETPLH